jgi:hypothetical protein
VCRRSISVSEKGWLQNDAKTGDTPLNIDEILKGFLKLLGCSADQPISSLAMRRLSSAVIRR